MAAKFSCFIHNGRELLTFFFPSFNFQAILAKLPAGLIRMFNLAHLSQEHNGNNECANNTQPTHSPLKYSLISTLNYTLPGRLSLTKQ